MSALLFKTNESLLPNSKDSFVYRAIIGDFHQRIANANVVVLVAAHEAAKLYHTGQDPLGADLNGFWP
jgi:hypothetical protein